MNNKSINIKGSRNFKDVKDKVQGLQQEFKIKMVVVKKERALTNVFFRTSTKGRSICWIRIKIENENEVKIYTKK